jgi:hypothetical protein
MLPSTSLTAAYGTRVPATARPSPSFRARSGCRASSLSLVPSFSAKVPVSLTEQLSDATREIGEMTAKSRSEKATLQAKVRQGGWAGGCDGQS